MSFRLNKIISYFGSNSEKISFASIEALRVWLQTVAVCWFFLPKKHNYIGSQLNGSHPLSSVFVRLCVYLIYQVKICCHVKENDACAKYQPKICCHIETSLFCLIIIVFQSFVFEIFCPFPILNEVWQDWWESTKEMNTGGWTGLAASREGAHFH